MQNIGLLQYIWDLVVHIKTLDINCVFTTSKSTVRPTTWSAVMRSSSDTVVPTACHRCNIFFERSCVARAQWRGDGPHQHVTPSVYCSKYNEGFNLIWHDYTVQAWLWCMHIIESQLKSARLEKNSPNQLVWCWRCFSGTRKLFDWTELRNEQGPELTTGSEKWKRKNAKDVRSTLYPQPYLKLGISICNLQYPHRQSLFTTERDREG